MLLTVNSHSRAKETREISLPSNSSKLLWPATTAAGSYIGLEVFWSFGTSPMCSVLIWEVSMIVVQQGIIL